MTKVLLPIILLFAFFLQATSVRASLVTITPDGEVVVNVLSSEDVITLDIPESESFEVKDVADSQSDKNSLVSIEKKGDMISMVVTTSDYGTRELDVTNYNDELVEIEEREKAKIVRLGVSGDKLSITQSNVTALTSLPINVDPARKELSITTSSGRRYVSILPQEALDSIMRTKIINEFGENSSLSIVEEEGGNISYLIEGKKVIDVFNVYDYELDVTARVSATTGELVSIENPEWLTMFNFLFV